MPGNPADILIDAFFGPANSVPRSVALEPWIARLREGVPTVLPARTGSAELRLYGISPSRAASRGLAEELVAAIGPSWSDFEGASARLDGADPVEAALLAHETDTGAGPTLRLAVRDREEAWRAMGRLLAGWEQRPAPRDEGMLLAPLPDVLRDVELALSTSAVDEAARLVEILRRRGELSSQNLLFLELRLLAAGGRWPEVLRHPRLDDVLHAHRPVGVTAMLFEALGEGVFAEAAAASDADAALHLFRDRIKGPFAPLVAGGPELTSTAALQVRILAVVDAGGSREAAAALVESAAPADRPWLQRLATLGAERLASEVPEPVEEPPSDPIELARKAGWEGAHRRVIELLTDAPPSVATVELLVGAAIGTGGLDAARVAAKAFAELPDGDQEALRRMPLLAAPLERVLALGGNAAAVSSWRQWLTRVGADEPFPAAVNVAELGSAEWRTTYPASAAEAAEFGAGLTGMPASGRDDLERALPYLLAYLDRRPQPDDVALPVHAAIFEVLAYGESRTRAVREATLVVLDRLLQAAPPAHEYAEHVALLEHVWDGSRSASALGWLADVVVALVHHPCSSPAAREGLIRRALADALSLRELDAVDVDVLRLVASDPVFEGHFGAEVETLPRPPAPAVAGTPGAPTDPGPLTVGIYTLSEPAARRAKAVLEQRYPALDVQLNHEHDDSERLRGLARRADVMAMVIASAKHAATDAIRKTASDDALLEVGTAGSTGLVRAVVSRLEELAAV